jgi:hypothetical protein
VFVLAIVAVLAAWPSAAYAESDILAWFEQLSGPGPFRQKYPIVSGIGFRVLCGSKSEGGAHGYWERYGADRDNTRPCLESTSDVKWYIYAHYSYLTTGDRSQFNETVQRAINAHTVNVYARLRVNPAVDLGMGVGGTYFTDGRGAGSFNAIGDFTLTPVSLQVRPFQFFRDNRFTRSIAVEYNQAIRYKSLTSVDFGGAAGGYSAGTELNARTTIVVDFGPLFFSKK